MVSINLKADNIQFEFDFRQFSRHFDWTWGSSMKFWETGLHNFQYHDLHQTPKKVEEIRYFCNNSVWRWEDIWSRGMTVRQFQIFHSEAIPIKLPPIVKVTCFCAEREIWGWRKIWKNAQREFLGMDRVFFRTDCYWPVSRCPPPLPLRLFFSHWQGWGWIEKRQLLDFRRNSFAQNWSRITKNLSHRFLLSRKTAAAWAAMPFTTLTNLTSLSLWAAQRAELGPTQKAKEFTDSTSTFQSLCNWSHGFSGSSSGAKLHHCEVTMRLKLSST